MDAEAAVEVAANANAHVLNYDDTCYDDNSDDGKATVALVDGAAAEAAVKRLNEPIVQQVLHQQTANWQ